MTRTGGDAALAMFQRIGGTALVHEMIALFLQAVPERLERVRGGLAAGDLEAVRMATHAVKSTAAQFGAAPLAALCATAEQRASRGLPDSLPHLLDAIEDEHAAVRGWLIAVRDCAQAVA